MSAPYVTTAEILCFNVTEHPGDEQVVFCATVLLEVLLKAQNYYFFLN